MSGFSAKAKLVTSRSSLRGVRGDGVQKIWHQFHQMRPNVGICWIRCNTFASFCSLGLASVLTLRMTNSAALDLFTSKTSLPSHAWLRNAVLRHPFCLFQSKQNYFKPKVNLMSKKSKNFVCVYALFNWLCSLCLLVFANGHTDIEVGITNLVAFATLVELRHFTLRRRKRFEACRSQVPSGGRTEYLKQALSKINYDLIQNAVFSRRLQQLKDLEPFQLHTVYHWAPQPQAKNFQDLYTHQAAPRTDGRHWSLVKADWTVSLCRWEISRGNSEKKLGVHLDRRPLLQSLQTMSIIWPRSTKPCSMIWYLFTQPGMCW